MYTTSNNAQAAMRADHACSGREFFSMPANAATAYMCFAAAASAIILTTGVMTSVSLFVPVYVVVSLILLGLVVLLSLLLIRLTGLVTLVSLVGLEIKRAARTAKGD